jgi:hypothetical protein
MRFSNIKTNRLGGTVMAVSEKQLEANRINAQRSTGPRTREGKLRSRRNAVKHGLTAEVVSVEGEDAEELAAEEAEWLEELAPRGRLGRRFAQRAFRAYVRLDRAERARDARLAARSQRAVEHWILGRAGEVHDAIALLETAPGVAVARLTASAEGAAWMILAWKSLLRKAESMLWTAEDDAFAGALIGVERVGQGMIAEISRPIVELTNIKERLASTQLSIDSPPEAILAALGDADTARLHRARAESVAAGAELAKLIGGRIASLEAEVVRLAPQTEREIELAVPLSLYDPSPEARRLDRYAKEAESAFQKYVDAAKRAEPRPQTVASILRGRSVPASGYRADSGDADIRTRERLKARVLDDFDDDDDDDELDDRAWESEMAAIRARLRERVSDLDAAVESAPAPPARCWTDGPTHPTERVAPAARVKLPPGPVPPPLSSRNEPISATPSRSPDESDRSKYLDLKSSTPPRTDGSSAISA